MRNPKRKRRIGFKNEDSYREELRRRDRIRMAYYAEQNATPEPKDLGPEAITEPLYFTRQRSKGWFEVVGLEGVIVSKSAMRLINAEKLAKDLNHGVNS